MGLCVDPNKSFPYVLLTDREKTEAEQPKFYFRYLSAAKCGSMEETFRDAAKLENDTAIISKIVEGLKLALSGWENVKDDDGKSVAYDPAKLEDVVSRADITELRDNIAFEMTITELEKKRAAYAAQSTTGSSAKLTEPAPSA